MSRPTKTDEIQRALGRLEGRQEAAETILKKVGSEVEAIASCVASINQTLAKNTHELEIHVAGVQQLREQNSLMRQEINNRLSPLERRHARRKAITDFCLRVMGAFAGLASSTYVAIKIWQSF